jgi:hypothetical protein
VKPRLIRAIATLALAATATLAVSLIEELTTPPDTSWGAPTLTVDTDTPISTRVTLDTSWG